MMMTAVAQTNLAPLRRFVIDFANLLANDPPEEIILGDGGALLRGLIGAKDWLPEAFAVPSGRYSQHLLHCDSRERFSVVSFAWAPGAGTPIHDHTVWGLVGMLRGSEISQPFERTPEGLKAGSPVHLRPGDVEAVSPSIGDIHQVTNGLADAVSVSIHVYGANIGTVRRHAFDAAGEAKPFVSGYSNLLAPNIWSEASPAG